MESNLKENYTEEEIFLADLAKALSHPARIKILQILSDKNSCICGDIVDQLPLAQSTVSQHMKELKRVGLIKGEIETPKICYCLDSKIIQKAKRKFDQMFFKINKCC